MSLTISVSDIINQSTSELLSKHESWERVELGSIAKVLNGFAFNSANFSQERGIPLIRIRDISHNFTETQYDGPYDEVYLVKPDNLLVGMDGDFNCALWTGPVGLLNQRVCKIEVYKEFFSKKFLSYVLPGYLNAINDVTSSMTVKHLSSKSIEEVPLPLPPLPEQNHIVAAIEQQFTRLDNAVASLQRARARAKQYHTSLLKAAVEGELTKDWRAEHPAEETGAQLLARILAERRTRWEEEQLAKMRERGVTPKDDKWKQAYKEPQGPDVEQLPALPEGWCWATVENLLLESPCNGISIKGSETPPGFPALKLSAMSDSGFDYDDRRYIIISDGIAGPLAIQKGDFFVSRGNGSLHLVGRGTLAQTPPEHIVFPDTMIRLRFMNIGWLRHYIAYVWPSKFVRKQIEAKARTTAGIYKISQSDIKSFVLPLPSLAEQEQIVAEVEARLSNIAQMEETIEASLKRAEHERQSILREAFAGRLVPQNPEDEPASMLLERIRKEREEAEKVVKVNRKGVQMEIAKKRRAGKTSLYKTLVEARRRLPPDDLFRRAGLKRDEQSESVEVFYEELHADVEDALIRETRPDNAHVLLEALEPSAEVLARMTEEEAAAQAQEAQQGKKSIDAPTLWNREPSREP